MQFALLDNILQGIPNYDGKWLSPYSSDNFIYNWNKETNIEYFILRNNIKYQYISELDNKVNPFYSVSLRKIFIPQKKYFKNKENYYNSFLHEIIHYIGFKCCIFDHNRMREEIIAEIGSLLLLEKFNLKIDIKNPIDYILWHIKGYFEKDCLKEIDFISKEIDIKSIPIDDILDLLNYCYKEAIKRIGYLI